MENYFNIKSNVLENENFNINENNEFSERIENKISGEDYMNVNLDTLEQVDKTHINIQNINNFDNTESFNIISDICQDNFIINDNIDTVISI